MIIMIRHFTIGLVFIIILVITYIIIRIVKTNNRLVYLDNNGTTKTFDESLELMEHVYKNYYGNASAMYSLGAKSKRLLELCRDKLSVLLNCETCEIFFTSGATESNNIAIRGVFSKYREKGKHVISTSIEHPSVYETIKSLPGAHITFLPVDNHGLIDLQELSNAIRKDTVLVSVIGASNEIGTIQDIKAIAQICRNKGVHFHCDMTQIIGKYKINLKELGIDSVTGSSHKFHGPKSCGFLYLKKGTECPSILTGGHQEKNIRSGTENIPGIVAMCFSLYKCYKLIDQGKNIEMAKMKEWMKHKLLRHIPGLVLNGHPSRSLYNTLSMCLPCDSRKLLMALDKKNICINTGSACSKGKTSAVLDAIGVPVEQQKGSARISLGFLNTWSDVEIATRNIIHLTTRGNP
jgi:cysteine desulfurase